MSEGKGCYKYALTAGTTTTGGDVLSLANPEGVDLLVTAVILDITTDATGAANLECGIAADGTTSASDIFDTVALAAGTFDSRDADNQGTTGKGLQKWESDEYLTITPSATCAGLVGNAYIQYIRV